MGHTYAIGEQSQEYPVIAISYVATEENQQLHSNNFSIIFKKNKHTMTTAIQVVYNILKWNRGNKNK